MLVLLIVLAIFLFVGIPGFFLYSACVVGSSADQCEEDYQKKKKRRPPMTSADSSLVDPIVFDPTNEYA